MAGASGNYAKLTRAVLGIGASLVWERPWTFSAESRAESGCADAVES